MSGRHPEQQEDEIYLGNYEPETVDEDCGWTTKRLGQVALDSGGRPLEEEFSGNRPLFIKKAEIIAAGMGDRTDLFPDLRDPAHA